MKKHSEDGGVACGICSVSLQQASLGFGIADLTLGVVGVAAIISMIIKKESDDMYNKEKMESGKLSGYTKFVKDFQLWKMMMLLGSFILQIALGMILCIGATHRSSILCALWTIVSFLASPILPMTYCLLGLGRVFEWAAVGEWILKMDNEESHYSQYRPGNSRKNDISFVGDENHDDDG